MKKTIQLKLLGLVVAFAPLAAMCQTTFFTDNFASSTTNLASVRTGLPTASVTSYDIASTKTTMGANGPTIAPGKLHLSLNAATTSGFWEAQAMFATNGQPVSLSTVGDYIEINVVFTNSAGTMFSSTAAPLWVGLYNSGGSAPLAGSLNNAGLTTATGSAFATGNCANWQGYVAAMYSGATTSSRYFTRPVQVPGTGTSANQDLVGNNFGGGAFISPQGNTFATLSPNPTFSIPTTGPYTLAMRLTLTSDTSLVISNAIYSGVGTGGTLVFANTNGVVSTTNSTFLATSFDGLAIGMAAKTTSANPAMDISSITIFGQSTPITTPPTITLQPVGVVVATNGSCRFYTAAVGSSVTYQWKRNSTTLTDGGHISGATTPTLTVSSAATGDAFSAANGYYCAITGTGPYTTNSITNALVLVPQQQLTFSGSAWDLATTPDWITNAVAGAIFNYGDAVTFDNTSALKFVTFAGNYLTAASVTVNSTVPYTFSGTGSFAGPGFLNYIGSGQLTINNANTYTGGTMISNPAALVYLGNASGLGTGIITLAKPGTIRTVGLGSATAGFGGFNVVDDFTIQVDGAGTFSAVNLGEVTGTAGKTLTFNSDPAQTNRIRFYGTNTTTSVNLIFNGNTTPAGGQAMYFGTVMAGYAGSGSQIYNGVISGDGGFVQRGNGITVLAGQNTYAGGTFTTAGVIGIGADSTPTSGTVTSGPFGTGPLFVAPEVGSATNTGGSGAVLAYGAARTIANPVQYPSGTNIQTLIVGGTNNLTFTGGYALSGQDNVGYQINRTIQVTNTGLTTISGVISDLTNGVTAAFGLTKTGTGRLALSATETYTGTTLIGAGTLLVNGALNAASSVTVSNTGTLGGSGTVNGVVTVLTNGVIAPGNSIGTLQINNNLFLAGNLAIEVNKSLVQSNDIVAVTGIRTNTGAGTLTVSNLGLALVAGDRFVVFSQPLSNGVAMTVAGGGTGVHWNNNLATDGSVTVSFVTVTSPATNITTVVNSAHFGQGRHRRDRRFRWG